MRASLAAIAIGVALFVVACSNGHREASTTSPVPASSTSPTEPSPAPTPEPTPAAIDWSHRLAVYTSAGQNGLLGTMVVWDLDANRLASLLEYTYKGEPGIAAVLADHDVIFATQSFVVQTSPDGRNRKELFSRPSDVPIGDVGVSPDGRLLAITSGAPNQAGELRILDLQTLQQRLLVQQSDPRLAAMRGSFWHVQWRADGLGVLVDTATYSEMYGSLATVFLDGRLRVEDTQGFGNVSPDGTLRAGDVGEIGCMYIGAHQLEIRDLDSGTVRVSANSPSTVYSPWEWSPDGTEFVFLQQEAATCDQLAPGNQVAWVVKTVAGGPGFGAPTRVTDLQALHQAWYGDRLFTADCDMGDEPVQDRWGKLRIYCYTASGNQPEVNLSVGGKPAGRALSPVPIGVLEP